MKFWLVIFLAAWLVACGKQEPASPPSTPLPTKEKTRGRVQDTLQKADEENAKRRAQVEAVEE